MISQRKRKHEIANALNKSPSTITREIKRHIKIKYQNIHTRENLFNCRFYTNCKVCTEQCNIFMPIVCSDRDRNIGACNTRKVSKKNKLKKRKEPANYEGRSYADYLEFKAKYPTVPTTEMDTVYNNQNGPYIQTFIFENTSFMIGILHKKNDVYSMASSLNKFQEVLTDEEFKRLFPLLLTDRGSEFMIPEPFEINLETGELRCSIFYCNPQQSSQKPHVENNHNMIRDILPNGQSWNQLTQEKVNLMFSHINSTARENLGGKHLMKYLHLFIVKKQLINLAFKR